MDRGELKGLALAAWPVALVIGWVAPDGGAWAAVKVAASAISLGLLVAFAIAWMRDRRAGDRSAELDARVVLAIGAIVAVSVAVLVEEVADSTTAATFALVGLIVPVLAAYLYVAARAGSAQGE